MSTPTPTPTPVPSPSTDLVGRELAPYKIERLIGQGGFSWVFVGRETDGTPVALKVLKPQYAGDPQFETRFRNESETAAQLEHPNIIRIRAVSKSGPHVYFSMDLYADSLGARITREGPLDEHDLVLIARDIAQGLAFAHERGVIHRDLKPDNILLRSDGHAVISDFGIARAVSGYIASTGVNMTIGTPQYLSPEQAQGRPLDPRSDIYSLGVTLYKAALGEVPFNHPDWFELARRHVEEPPPSLRKRRPELSKQFERLVLKCLAKHPEDRYETAQALAADLEDLGRKRRDVLGRRASPRPFASPGTSGITLPERAAWPLYAALAAAVGLLVGLLLRLTK
ncbi:MAG TPA: serine/threonine-protein kinase [Gemmatimonadales bacterium]|nr:serine/threonine-protein kinase [Gemmatimonadales bacterium]